MKKTVQKSLNISGLKIVPKNQEFLENFDVIFSFFQSWKVINIEFYMINIIYICIRSVPFALICNITRSEMFQKHNCVAFLAMQIQKRFHVSFLSKQSCFENEILRVNSGFPALVGTAGTSSMLQACMQEKFLQNLENSVNFRW